MVASRLLSLVNKDGRLDGGADTVVLNCVVCIMKLFQEGGFSSG